MKKIKIFSMVLALGLGLTATYAFKAHKTTGTVVTSTFAITYGVTGTLGYYDILTPEPITSGMPVCDANDFPNQYCTLTYIGPLYQVATDEYYIYQDASTSVNVLSSTTGQYTGLH